MRTDTNSSDDTTVNTTAIQSYLANSLSIDDKVKKEKEELIENILAASSQKNTTTPVRSTKRVMLVALSTKAEVAVNSTPKLTAPPQPTYIDPPSLPPSPKCPPLPFNSTGGIDWQQTDAAGMIKIFFDYYSGHETDPTALNNLMKLIEAGVPVPGFVTNNSNLQASFSVWAGQMADYAYFASPADPGGGTAAAQGLASMIAYLTNKLAELKALPNQGDPNIVGMEQAISGQLAGAAAFGVSHSDASGNMIWTQQFEYTAPSGTGGYILTWTPNPDFITDPVLRAQAYAQNDQIMSLMNAQNNADGTPNAWYQSINNTGMDMDYRVATLNQMMGLSPKPDGTFEHLPLAFIVCWLLQNFNNYTDSDVLTQNVLTDDLTQATNYSNELTNAMTAFSAGTGTDADAQKFLDGLFGLKSLVDSVPGFSQNVQDTINQQVYETIGGMSADQGNDPLAWALARGNAGAESCGYQPTSTMSATTVMLNAMFNSAGPSALPPSGGTTPAAPPNKNFQIASNAVSAGQAVVNGSSKTKATVIDSDMATEAADTKTCDALLSMVKGWSKFVSNFLTN